MEIPALAVAPARAERRARLEIRTAEVRIVPPRRTHIRAILCESKFEYRSANV